MRNCRGVDIASGSTVFLAGTGMRLSATLKPGGNQEYPTAEEVLQTGAVETGNLGRSSQ